MNPVSIVMDKLQLRVAERVAYSVAFSAILIDLCLIYWKGAAIDWAGYFWLVGLTLALFAVGCAYRIKQRSERIASALICTGGLIIFSMALSVFNYLLLPITQSPIDQYVVVFDAMVGYHWPSVMQWAADHPTLNLIMKICYMTTMPQLSLLVVVLGLVGRHKDLHVMILSVVISATLAICFWGIFPSLGAKSLYILPKELWAAVNPVVDELYTLELKRIAVEGPGIISSDEIRGLIAFPSYHASLAFIAMVASRNIKYVFPIFMVINLIILPATFIHGGHHFFDPFAGFALFLIAHYVAKKFVTEDHIKRQIPQIVPA